MKKYKIDCLFALETFSYTVWSKDSGWFAPWEYKGMFPSEEEARTFIEANKKFPKDVI